MHGYRSDPACEIAGVLARRVRGFLTMSMAGFVQKWCQPPEAGGLETVVYVASALACATHDPKERPASWVDYLHRSTPHPYAWDHRDRARVR